ncbi:MAG TPA: methylated-DNA--[protein]-cysteine S-methyltransferase [Dehalococcoidales bacterium]|nr:methylated-DNA--[protein]-cysteine S-methyltransferase [Dehalococcoidales bacterium]
MTRQLNYIIFDTDMGWVGVLASTAGLLSTTLPHPSTQEVNRLFGDSISHARWSPHLFQDLMERLRVYFSGHQANFPEKLDLSGATDFQREVWEAARLIPYGETRRYRWVAEQIKKPKALRAVGQALGRNPLPVIVPCHRVLASNGQLGGFTGGIEMKRRLLHLEGVTGFR